AAYLPVDVEYPVERVRFMLEDSRPALVLTDTSRVGPWTKDVPTLLVDDAAVRERLAGLDAADLATAPDPAHPAYVIYTSGSTGVPKGVVVSHVGLVNLVAASG
ncbi:hypothetical protein UK15_39365, partial [Streptomyces variegatus]